MYGRSIRRPWAGGWQRSGWRQAGCRWSTSGSTGRRFRWIGQRGSCGGDVDSCALFPTPQNRGLLDCSRGRGDHRRQLLMVGTFGSSQVAEDTQSSADCTRGPSFPAPSCQISMSIEHPGQRSGFVRYRRSADALADLMGILREREDAYRETVLRIGGPGSDGAAHSAYIPRTLTSSGFRWHTAPQSFSRRKKCLRRSGGISPARKSAPSRIRTYAQGSGGRPCHYANLDCELPVCFPRRARTPRPFRAYSGSCSLASRGRQMVHWRGTPVVGGDGDRTRSRARGASFAG